jgi:hypothetical protein
MKTFSISLILKSMALLSYRKMGASGGGVSEARYSAEARCCCFWVVLP